MGVGKMAVWHREDMWTAVEARVTAVEARVKLNLNLKSNNLNFFFNTAENLETGPDSVRL